MYPTSSEVTEVLAMFIDLAVDILRIFACRCC